MINQAKETLFNRDRLTEREQADSSGGDEGLEGLCQKDKELMDKDHSVVIVGGEG